MLNLIRSEALKVINEIDSGGSYMTKEDLLECLDLLKTITSPYYTSEQACNYLNICRSTLDKYVEIGVIEKPKKISGSNFFLKKNLEEFKDSLNNK